MDSIWEIIKEIIGIGLVAFGFILIFVSFLFGEATVGGTVFFLLIAICSTFVMKRSKVFKKKTARLDDNI